MGRWIRARRDPAALAWVSLDPGDRAAFDFLVTEALAHLDTDLRAFLLDTSVLHELDQARCLALTGARTARGLNEIERRGLFASVVDEAASADWQRVAGHATQTVWRQQDQLIATRLVEAA